LAAHAGAASGAKWRAREPPPLLRILWFPYGSREVRNHLAGRGLHGQCTGPCHDVCSGGVKPSSQANASSRSQIFRGSRATSGSLSKRSSNSTLEQATSQSRRGGLGRDVIGETMRPDHALNCGQACEKFRRSDNCPNGCGSAIRTAREIRLRRSVTCAGYICYVCRDWGVSGPRDRPAYFSGSPARVALSSRTNCAPPGAIVLVWFRLATSSAATRAVRDLAKGTEVMNRQLKQAGCPRSRICPGPPRGSAWIIGPSFGAP
jgi:hypothetical protein